LDLSRGSNIPILTQSDPKSLQSSFPPLHPKARFLLFTRGLAPTRLGVNGGQQWSTRGKWGLTRVTSHPHSIFPARHPKTYFSLYTKRLARPEAFSPSPKPSGVIISPT